MPFGGGVTELLLNEHVGALATAGATEHASATAELNVDLVDVTVMVAVAETPGVPEVGDRAPLVMEKSG